LVVTTWVIYYWEEARDATKPLYCIGQPFTTVIPSKMSAGGEILAYQGNSLVAKLSLVTPAA
jgi:hypothetical protein